MLRCGYQSLFYILFAWILAACGGGGGGGGVDASDGNISTGETLDVTPIISGSAPYTIDANNSLSVSVLVTDSSGDPVSNARVSFSASVGLTNVGSTLTGADGITVTDATIFAGATGTVTAGTLSITAISGSSVGVNSVSYESAEDGDNSSTTPTPSDTTLELSFLDSNGTEYPSQQSIPFGDTVTIRATLTPKPATNVSIQISATQTENDITTTFGTLSNSTLTIVPNTDPDIDNGLGEVTLATGSGSGTVSISATLSDDVSDTENISIISPSLLIGYARSDNTIQTNTIKIDNDESLNSITLADNGTTLLQAELFIESATGTFTSNSSTYNRYTQSAKIDYTSNCAITQDSQDTSTTKSTISYSNATTNTINGITVATYKTISCTSTDTVAATTTIDGRLLTATTAIEFEDQVADTLEFIDVKDSSGNEISNIALQGSPSNIPKSARVTFKVTDNGNPVQGTKVFFELTNTIGGVSLSTDDADTVTYPDGRPLSTDADGEVTVTVNSGNLPTDVAIKATIEDSSDAANDTTNTEIDSGRIVTATSTALTLSTGLPHQGAFTMAADTPVPNAFDYQGVPVQLTVRASDLSQQAAPDGTSINFKAENGGGQLVNEDLVDTTSCQLSNGSCNITWRSQSFTNKPDVSRSIDNFLDTTNPINNQNIEDVELLLGTLPSGNTIYQTLVSYADTQVADNNDTVTVASVTGDLTALGITAADILAAATDNETSVGSDLSTTVDITSIIAATDIAGVIDGTTFTYADAGISTSNLQNVNIATLPFSSYNSNPNDRYGLIQVLAWATGEETFTDNNSDGLFNGDMTAEEADDLAEAFTDNNQNNQRDNEPGINVEEFEDVNNNNTYDSANGIYNGFRCDDTAIGLGHCPSTNKLIDVRDDITIIAATNSVDIATIAPNTVTTYADFRDNSSTAFRPLGSKRAQYEGMLRPVLFGVSYDTIGNVTDVNIDDVGGAYSFTVMVYDENGNPPPAGTTIEVDAPSSAKLASPLSQLTIPNQSVPFTFTVSVIRDEDSDDNSGTLGITVTTPAVTIGNTSYPELEELFTVGIQNNNP